jgi:hypothetical protein
MSPVLTNYHSQSWVYPCLSRNTRSCIGRLPAFYHRRLFACSTSAPCLGVACTGTSSPRVIRIDRDSRGRQRPTDGAAHGPGLRGGSAALHRHGERGLEAQRVRSGRPLHHARARAGAERNAIVRRPQARCNCSALASSRSETHGSSCRRRCFCVRRSRMVSWIQASEDDGREQVASNAPLASWKVRSNAEIEMRVTGGTAREISRDKVRSYTKYSRTLSEAQGVSFARSIAAARVAY